MATYLLIRHALCDPVGHSIAGRTPGISLNAAGREQAAALAARLAHLKLDAVYSSPLERAVETARHIADLHGLEVQSLRGLDEIDFGEWTGLSLTELDTQPVWRRFNAHRSGTRIPGGESMADVVGRGLKEFGRLQEKHGPGSLIAVVSHADVLRSLLAHWLGMPLDMMLRLELEPASVTVLDLHDYGPRLLLLNETGDWPNSLPQV